MTDRTGRAARVREGHFALWTSHLSSPPHAKLALPKEEKKKLSPLITNDVLDGLEKDLLDSGVKGLKLLGSGGCGFFLCMSDPYTIQKTKDKFKDIVFEFSFEDRGSEQIFTK